MSCETCKHLEKDSNSKPCSVCIKWGDDGYTDFTQYEAKTEKYIKIVGGKHNMQCSDCQKKLVLFKCEDGEYRCIDCMKRLGIAKNISSDINEQVESHMPSYSLKWKLKDEEGHEWIENMDGLSLGDFEVIYGDNVHEVIWITLRLDGHAII